MIKVLPFSFSEYLELKERPIPTTEFDMIRCGPQMILDAEKYLYVGGLPEGIGMTPGARKNYIKNSLLEPIFFKDITTVFPSANPDLLLRTFELASATVGSTFQFQSIAQTLGCSHPTISLQIEILKRALLVRTIYNYSGSAFKQKRTAKKIFIADNGLLNNLQPRTSICALAENVIAQRFEEANFWRDSEGREVDFLVPEKKLAIEVKYQENIVAKDEANLKYFLERHPGWKGILITKKEEKEGEITRVPLWKWLLKTDVWKICAK